MVGFLEFKPPDYDKDVSTRYPLIIFLHGIGERGNGNTDLPLVTTWGIPSKIKSGYTMHFTWNGKTETFLVLSPQLPVKYGMWPSAMIDDLISYAKTNLRVDPDRIMLTGLSMGGGGVLRYISDALPDDPKTIAAAVSISSPCTFRTGQYAALAHLPIWCFHAQDDPTAPVTCTLNAINGLKQWNPAVTPLLTLWPSGGHNVWDRLYGDTSYQFQDVVNIYEWFLAQNKSLPANQLPVSNAGVDITAAPGTVQLNGSASYDPDGKIVRYVWKQISGPASATITSARSTAPVTMANGLTKKGIYVFELAVADNRASFTRDQVNITVSDTLIPAPAPTPGNSPPVANAGDDETLNGWNVCLLNATLSKDHDGWISSGGWTKISGPSACSIDLSTVLNTHVRNLVAGVYVFRATVTDNKGASAYDDKTITVLSPGPALPVSPGANIPPVAKAGEDVTLNGWNSCLLNATLSKDSDGWISSVSWTKFSGPSIYSISSPAVLNTHATNLVSGVYVFRVTVTDNKGASSYDDKTITVLSAGPSTPGTNIPPVANAGTDQKASLSWNQCMLNSSLSIDADGWLTAIKWDKISGPSTYSIQNPTSLVTNAQHLVEGIYLFQVTVTDNKGATSSDKVQLTVNKVGVSQNFELDDEVAGSHSLKEEVKAGIYPNPATGFIQLNVDYKDIGKTVVNVYDAGGRLMKAVSVPKPQRLLQTGIDISDLKNGIYAVQVVTGKLVCHIMKFIKI